MKHFLSGSWLRGLTIAISMGALTFTSAPAQAAAPTAQIAAAKYDLTGNQVVNAADVSEVADQWRALAAGEQLDAQAPNADVTVNGAIDVSDAQLIAAHAGEGTTDLALRAMSARASAAPTATEKVFVVNSANSGNPNDPAVGDANKDDGICATSSGSCTLQAAVQQSNAPRSPAFRAIIRFDVRSAGVCPDVVRILPNLDFGAWLQIDDSSGQGTVIDGYSQCGASANTNDVSGNAVIKVEIVGTKFGKNNAQYDAKDGVNGLEVKSGNNVIRGLSLYNWDRALELSSRALYNHIEGNFLGTNPANDFIAPPRNTQHGEGLRLQFGANYNVIGCGNFQADGTFTPCTDRAQVNAARNIIAGNGNDGIHFERVDVNHNHVVGNYIGVAQDGKVRKTSAGTSISKNQADGVDFEEGANNNWLGGETDLERNIIAGNQSDGIEVSHGSATQGNRVVGNWFGIDAYGNAAGNGNNGISFEDTVKNNFAYKNIVGSNNQSGIRGYVLAAYTEIRDNYIGLLPDGTSRPNGRNGVYLMGGSHHNIVRNNIIANNGDRGVVISTESDDVHNFFGETYFNTISKNSIYNNKRDGIKLTNKQDPQPIGNQALAKPVIVGANTTLVVGTTCANCKVEVFISDKTQLPDPSGENSGEGKTFVGEGVATGGGEFAVAISGVAPGQLITATGTDSTGNTSEFARNFGVTNGPVATLAPKPTVTPSPTPSPTAVPAPELTRRVWVPMSRR